MKIITLSIPKRHSFLNLPLSILVSVLVIFSQSKLTLRDPNTNIPAASIARDDIYSIDLEKYVDYSESFGKTVINSNIGEFFNIDDVQAVEYRAKDEELRLNFVKKINESLFAVVYDNSKIVFQSTDFQGRRLQEFFEIKFDIISTEKLYCTDLAYYRPRNLVYVACFTRKDAQFNSVVYIQPIDIITKKMQPVVVIDTEPSLQINNILKIFIAEIYNPESQLSIPHLFAYDSGNPQDMNTIQNSYNIMAFSNVQSYNLLFKGIVSIKTPESSNGQIRYLFDIYFLNGEFIISGRNKDTGGKMALFGCDQNDLTIPMGTLNCRMKVKNFDLKKAYFSLSGNSLSVLDLDLFSFKRYTLEREVSFNSPQWATNLSDEYLKIETPLFTNFYVPMQITGSRFGTCISWIQSYPKYGVPPPDYVPFTALGATVFYFNSQYKEYRDTAAAFVNGKSLLLSSGDKDDGYIIGISRITRGFVGVTFDDIPKVKNNNLTISVSDNDNTVNLQLAIVAIDHIFEKVEINNEIGNPVVGPNNSPSLNLTYDNIIYGNGLNELNIKIIPENAPIQVKINFQSQIQLNFDIPPKKALKYWFSGDHVLILDSEQSNDSIRKLKFYKCIDSGKDQVNCLLNYSTNVEDSSIKFENDKTITTRDQEIVFISANSSTNSIIYGLSRSGKVMKYNVKHPLDSEKDKYMVDFDILDTMGGYTVNLLIAFPDQINIFEVSKVKLNVMGILDKYTAKDFFSDELCIQGISLPYQGKEDSKIDIFSNCGGERPTVYRVNNRMVDHTFVIRVSNTLKIDNFCSLGEEIIFGTNLGPFSTHIQDDLNYASSPFDDLGLYDGQHLSCLSRANRFIVTARNGYAFPVVVQGIGGKGSQQGKRFPAYDETLIKYVFKGAFEFFGSVIVIFKHNSEFVFDKSRSVPEVQLSYKPNGIQSGRSAVIEMEIGNNYRSQIFWQSIQIRGD